MTPIRFVALAAVLLALPASGSISVKPSGNAKSLNVAISGEPLSVAVSALEMHLGKGVSLNVPGDPVVHYAAREVSATRALKAIAAKLHLEVRENENAFELVDPRDRTVTLDVKDAEVAVILKSMQRQCGIKNVIVDPGVSGKGTFIFRDVPCRTAFSVVMRSLGLAMETWSNDVISVERPRG